ncbi:MAG: hypothetical protein L3J43_07755 [Sulfurovum sp.]|nr:hypothetical protein [Sulfurovum sp.]
MDNFSIGGILTADRINGIKHEDLVVSDYTLEKTLDEQTYILHYKDKFSYELHVPIRVRILYIIKEAKKELEEYKHEQFLKEKAIARKKSLACVIKCANEIENIHKKSNYTEDEREQLTALKLMDGERESRIKAIASYKKQLEHTEKVLKGIDMRRKDAKRRDIKKKCLNDISHILRKAGIKKHRIKKHRTEAITLIRWNGIDMPNSY